jgi:hypothetical protein
MGSVINKPLNTDKYITKDLWLTGFLKSKGFIPKLEQPKGNQVELFFVFENSKELRSLADQFFVGSVTVHLPDIRNQVKEIRQWLDDAKEAQFS